MFTIQERETKLLINSETETIEEAKKVIEQLETDDRLFGAYVPNKYEIVERP